jgi:arylsulfatase A-like enzyme
MSNQKPNILLIVLDTLRRDHLSSYGYHRETSPEFDEFASQSARYERAVSAAQWTIPSHASMFTGLYPTTHQVTQASSHLSGMYPTATEVLQAGGYHTVGFCNNPLVSVVNHGLQRGFDKLYNYATAAPYRPVEETRSYLHREFMRRFRQLARRIGNEFANHDEWFRYAMHPRFVSWWTRGINFKGNTSNSIDDLIAYWNAHTAGGNSQPIFAFLNLMGAHLPYTPPQDFMDRVAPQMRHDKHAYNFMSRFNTEAVRWASPPDGTLADWQLQTINDFYDAEVAYQDYHLGRLLGYMRQSGALDNTLVILVSDHGDAHGDHDHFGHGFVVYQELVHVPLVIHDPEGRLKAGSPGENISTRRIFHTMLDAAGLKPPLDEADPNADVDGLSLLGGKDSDAGIVFSEAVPPTTFLNVILHNNPSVIERMRLQQTRRGIYEGDHKLTMVQNDIEELFDVQDDPLETTSLTENLPSLAADLRNKLNSFVAQAEQERAEGELSSEVSEEVVEHLRALGYIE